MRDDDDDDDADSDADADADSDARRQMRAPHGPVDVYVSWHASSSHGSSPRRMNVRDRSCHASPWRALKPMLRISLLYSLRRPLSPFIYIPDAIAALSTDVYRSAIAALTLASVI